MGGLAMPPTDPMFGVNTGVSEAPSPMADLSGWLASMLDVALPPVVVAVVLSPLIVLEVVARTVLRSGLALLPPIVLLGGALLFFRWRDRRRETGPALVDDDPLEATS